MPTICFSLFIKPSSIGLPLSTGTPLDQHNLVVLHGDGRDFSSNSDPSKSRGYMWIRLDTSTAELHVNPTGYIAPAGNIWWAAPSEQNTYTVEDQDGSIVVKYDLVLGGVLEDAAPHINGDITFSQRDGTWHYAMSRDGFPWAEAYYWDAEHKVTTIFQDPADRGNPIDLYAIESPCGAPIHDVILSGIEFAHPALRRRESAQ